METGFPWPSRTKEYQRAYMRARRQKVRATQPPREPSLNSIARAAGLKEETLRRRIKNYGWTMEKALSTPVRPVRFLSSDPQASRRRHLQKNYGLTLEEFDRRLVEQDGKCFLCKRTENECGFARAGFVVDHCHKTGQQRKILCHSCNVALGLFQDNPETLKRAVEYLTANRETNVG